MQIQIKLLGRDPYFFQVASDSYIFDFKFQIAQCIGIPIEEQRLVFQGIILQDEKRLEQYSNIQDNSKIHLIVIIKKKYPLYHKMYEIIRPHCSEKESNKILSVFMRKMYDLFRSLSLDDLERIAQEALHNKFVENMEKDVDKLPMIH